MSIYSLSKTRLKEGVWQGILTDDKKGADKPEISVTLLDMGVPGISINAGNEEGEWIIHVPIPTYAIADGVHTFLIKDATDSTVLDSFTLIAGEALAEDIRSEMELLRAELDMLKRAFRRHCLETM